MITITEVNANEGWYVSDNINKDYSLSDAFCAIWHCLDKIEENLNSLSTSLGGPSFKQWCADNNISTELDSTVSELLKEASSRGKDSLVNLVSKMEQGVKK